MDSKSSSIFNKLSGIKFKTLRLKNKCARLSENSLILNTIDKISSAVFVSSLRSVGVFLLATGGVITSAILSDSYKKISVRNFSDTFVFGLLLLLGSFIFLPQKNKNISQSILESRILSYLFLDVFYVKHLDVSDKKSTQSFSALAFIFGIIFGSVSYAVSPIPAIFILLFIAYLYLIFTGPENGILLICIHLPLITNSLLWFFIIATAISLIFKIIRGKRSFSFNICSCATLLIGFILLSCTAVSFDIKGALEEFLPFISAILLCFCIIVTVRSSTLSDKCFRMIGISVIISLILGINGIITTAIASDSLISTFSYFLTGGFKATLTSSESCAAFLIATIPFFVFKSASRSRIFSLPVLILAVACLLICNSYVAVFALFASIIVTGIVFSRRCVFTAITATVVYLVITQVLEFASKFISSTVMLENDLQFRSVAGLGEFFSHYGVCGAGMGKEAVAFASLKNGINAFHIENRFGVYTDFSMRFGIPLVLICVAILIIFISKTISYAKANHKSYSAQGKCIALFTSVVALGIFALYSDFLYDFRILTLFFMILGLSAAVVDSADADFISPEKYTDYKLYEDEFRGENIE